METELTPACAWNEVPDIREGRMHAKVAGTEVGVGGNPECTGSYEEIGRTERRELRSEF